MKLPLSTEALKDYLPHREPMIWIDEVVSLEGVTGICRFKVNPELPYWTGSGILATAPIEWIAQASGYCHAARVFLGYLGPEKKISEAFLVGVRDAQLGDLTGLRAGTVVTVTVELLKELGPLSVIRGSIEADNVKLAEASLKLFGR